MNLPEFDLQKKAHDNLSIFTEIFENGKKGFIIRNFLDTSQLELILNLKNNFLNIFYSPFDGYKALPRPFDEIEKNNTIGYLEEIEILNSNNLLNFKNEFLKKLKALSVNYKIETAEISNDSSKSMAWASLRILQPNKGKFELHCGNLFINWNKLFFEKQNNEFDITKHLAFLVMVQKPTAESDINIYNAHWKDYKEKVDVDNLKNTENRIIPLDQVGVDIVKLNPGDLLIFDESNYWHNVLPFSGKERVTFGGFISKKHNEKEVLLWA